MNHKNNFKAFSINNNANVLSQERYEESQSLKTGFPPDNITVHLLNKVLRQSSTIASVVSSFIATYSGNDVLDDGDIVKLTTQLNRALEQKITTEVPTASLTQKGVTQLTDKTGNSNTLVVTQKLVSDVNDNANNRLAKNQNGADIPNKSEFIKNLGLVETVELAKSAVPSSRKINGKSLSNDINLSAEDVKAQPAGNYAVRGEIYTKSESDGRYQPHGNYQPAGNYAVRGESYTKEESDGRYDKKQKTFRRIDKINGYIETGSVIDLDEDIRGKYLYVKWKNTSDFVMGIIPADNVFVNLSDRSTVYGVLYTTNGGKKLHVERNSNDRITQIHIFD
ncbi:phage tail protein [Photorhabdus luminescens]|uniref:phage tail protein n=1 Tax=Photorhabdus luminescens TaxID=29488 RepID=UPI0020CF5523|nr:phage tail protein [Photorhabdus luminescens]